MRWRWLLLSATLLAGGRARAMAATATSISNAELLPVRHVTVFSDRARVVREGKLPVERGRSTVELPSLPATIDPSTVRLDATGAKVLRVRVVRADEGELPKNEAEQLIAKLETLSDEMRALQDGLSEWGADRDFVNGITPAATPGGDATHPPLLLDPAGWTDVLHFFDARETTDDDSVAALEAKIHAKEKEVAQVAAEARRLAGNGAGTPGYKVEAVLDAAAKSASLSLAYVAMGARWYPTYDVRYDPDAAKVQVSFGGLVSQTTGEDWKDAKLVLSTAIPASTATLPKLAVWKIGEQERFIPTPAPAWQPPVNPPPPPMPWATPPHDERTDAELRNALYVAANAAEAGVQVDLEAASNQVATAMVGEYAKKAESSGAYARAEEMDEAPTPPAAPPMPEPPMAMPSRAYAGRAPAARMPESMALSSVNTLAGEPSETPTEQVAFGAPRGWQPPYYAADLPAALAGGYTFVYPAAKAETVLSGGEAHRVALFTETFPAQATVRILPALSKSAYLVAELTNSGDRPLLKGRAHLFVGSDLVGDAEVPTTAVGQTVTLPLGIDEAIKVERNVHVVSHETGLFSKDDVSAYEVVIEVVNPRQKTVHALVEDQVPVAHGEHVAVKVDGVDPTAQLDAVNGLVDWKVDLKPGEKRTFTLRYSITRPKDWKLTQSNAPTGTNP